MFTLKIITSSRNEIINAVDSIEWKIRKLYMPTLARVSC